MHLYHPRARAPERGGPERPAAARRLRPRRAKSVLAASTRLCVPRPAPDKLRLGPPRLTVPPARDPDGLDSSRRYRGGTVIGGGIATAGTLAERVIARAFELTQPSASSPLTSAVMANGVASSARHGRGRGYLRPACLGGYGSCRLCRHLDPGPAGDGGTARLAPLPATTLCIIRRLRHGRLAGHLDRGRRSRGRGGRSRPSRPDARRPVGLRNHRVAASS